MPGRRLPVVLRAIGSNVRRLREARGWTQAELAEQVDVALRYLQQIEHAAASPSLRRLVALSHALEVDITMDELAPDHELLLAFEAYDLNGDGRISEFEFGEYVAALPD